MIDTHCHLWFQDFDSDREEVIRRAREAGVHTMIQVGCDEKSSRQSIELAEKYEGMYATVGLHPNDHASWNDGKALEWMRELIDSSKKVVALGETGLDYYRSSDQAELQQVMFREHCLLAQEFDLPVIVHLRSDKHAKGGVVGNAHLVGAGPTTAGRRDLPLPTPVERDCLKVLDDVGMKPGKVLFHCFSSDRAMAEEVLKRGWFISFSGVITYPNAEELREVAKMSPMDRILVETDAPFLTPQKNRGGRNEPGYVVETAGVISELKDVSVEEMERQTDANARKLFGIN